MRVIHGGRWQVTFELDERHLGCKIFPLFCTRCAGFLLFLHLVSLTVWTLHTQEKSLTNSNRNPPIFNPSVSFDIRCILSDYAVHRLFHDHQVGQLCRKRIGAYCCAIIIWDHLVGQGTILHVALQHLSFNIEDPMTQMMGNFVEKCSKCPWWQDALCMQRKKPRLCQCVM